MAVVVQLSTDSWRHVHRIYSVVQLGSKSFCQTLRRHKKEDRLPATYFAISNPYKSNVYKSVNLRLKGVALAPGGRQSLVLQICSVVKVIICFQISKDTSNQNGLMHIK